MCLGGLVGPPFLGYTFLGGRALRDHPSAPQPRPTHLPPIYARRREVPGACRG